MAAAYAYLRAFWPNTQVPAWGSRHDDKLWISLHPRAPIASPSVYAVLTTPGHTTPGAQIDVYVYSFNAPCQGLPSAVTNNGDKSFFTEIGAAWKNTKGGYHVKLNALPVTAEIILLPPKED